MSPNIEYNYGLLFYSFSGPMLDKTKTNKIKTIAWLTSISKAKRVLNKNFKEVLCKICKCCILKSILFLKQKIS